MKIAIVGGKGGAGRSTTALVLAHGLALEEHTTTLLECVTPGRKPGLAPEQGPPFRYLPVAVESGITGTALAERVTAAETSGDLVLDLPPMTPEDTAALLPVLDLVLIPLHPDPADLAATRAFLEALHALQPGWKAKPPRWVLHVDIVQSLRNSLALVDALVKGWGSPSLPPLVLPWTLPRLSRPDLRALGSGAAPTGSLAATCRILARAALEIADASPEDVLLPRSLDARLPEELRARFRGEDRSLAEKCAGLAADVAAVRAGLGPTPTDLLGAPVLDDWSLEPYQAQLLAGKARGHPRLGSQPVRTTMAVLVDEQEGWARTLSRFYRLGRKAKQARSADRNG